MKKFELVVELNKEIMERKINMDLLELKDWIGKTSNKAFDFINSTENKDIVLFGGGAALYWYLKFFNKYGVISKIKYIVDNDSKKKGGKLYDIPVIGLSDILYSSEEYRVVITAPKYLGEIKEVLLKSFPEENIFSFEAEIYYNFIHDISVYKKYLLDNWNRVIDLYMVLEDELSKKTLKAFVQGRISGEQKYFIDVMVENQYYPKDIIKFNENEVMVELGANDGKTLLTFLNIVNRKYNKIYCFEPDKVCIEQLKELCSHEDGKIEIVEKGAWDAPAVLPFHSDAQFGASHIVECDLTIDENILVDTIDNCVNTPVTYIKMDIEGAELRALHGGKQTIQSCKPKLAICVYHNQEDLLDIVDYLKKLVPEYKFYLRHHNWGATETVLYAIL